MTFIAKFFRTVVKLRPAIATEKITGLWKGEGGFHSQVWVSSFICQEIKIPEQLTKFVMKVVFIETIFLFYRNGSNNNE